jgi:hypothetical protein
LAVVLGVFFWLPEWVADSESERQDAAAAQAEAAALAAAVEPSAPKLSPQEVAALREQAETLLAGLLTQEQRLSAQSVAAWGGGEWQRYSELSNAGDDAFLADDFATAIESYSAASAAGDQLLARSVQIVERALAAAAEAFAAGTVEVALRQYDVVLGVDPEHAGAKAGRARAERLPEVLALVRQADEEQERGNAQAALAR